MRSKYGGMSKEAARADVETWKYEAEYPELDGIVSYSQYQRWQTDGKPRGVSFETFVDVASFRDDGTSSKVKAQEDVRLYIESVASDRNTRHGLWCCFYKESTSPYR